ncbi:hypothetical protein HY837_05635 [archaeon]|nr:hypothetical protein [archaeon]
MKVSKFKKVLALGAAISLLGTTILSAQALTLADYPKPFISEGTPSSDLILIVGEKATASDVVSMGNIITSLQQMAVKEEALPSLAPKKAQIEGDYVEIGSPTDLLEINETIGEIRGSISEFDLGFLKGGSISTSRGVTKYNQYIQFNDSSRDPSKKVIFTEDDFDNVGDFLFFSSGHQVFDWTLEFEEGLISDVSSTNSSTASLDDLNDREINILGTPYTIVNAVVDTTKNNGRVRIDLLGGLTFGQLGENQDKTITLGDEEYKVEVMILSETSGEALIKVNGKLLPKIRPGEAVPLPSGDLFGIRDIITTGKETQSSMVRFYIGASKISFTDNNLADGKFTDGGARVNNEIVEKSAVEIGSSLSSDRSQLSINHIKYRLNAGGLNGGDVLVPPGHGVREYLTEPEGLLAPVWDIKYNGLSDVPLTTIKIEASGRDEYKLRFTNQEGLTYKIPIASVRLDGTMRHGDSSSGRQRGLWNVETNEADRFFISTEDLIVLSDISSASSTFLGNSGQKQLSYSGCVKPSSTSDNTAFTRLLKYQNVVNLSGDISYTFNDLASGTKQAKGNSTGGFSLIVGGKTYLGIKDKNSDKLSIDVNGDGTFTKHRLSWIATEGGLLIGLNSSPATTPISTGETSAGALGNHSCITYTTAASQFDEGGAQSGGSLSIAIPIEKSGSGIGLNMNDILGIQKPIALTSNPTIRQQIDDYGGLFEFFDPSTTGVPQELTYEYPLIQRGGQVIITGGPVLIGAIKGPTTTKIQNLPAGISKLDSEVSNIESYNSIVIGGPCANSWSDYLMQKPRPCYESIPDDTAIVQLFQHSTGKVSLLVAGFSAEDTKKAAKAVENLEIKKVGTVNKVKVKGTMDNLLVVPV